MGITKGTTLNDSANSFAVDLFRYKPAYNNLFTASIFSGNSSDFSLAEYSTLHIVSLHFLGPELLLKRNETSKLFALDGYRYGDTVTITWRENDKFLVREMHQNWLAKFYDESRDCFISYDTKTEAENSLQKTILVDLGNDHKLILEGIFPKKVPDLDLSFSNASIVTYSLSYSVTSWRWL